MAHVSDITNSKLVGNTVHENIRVVIRIFSDKQFFLVRCFMENIFLSSSSLSLSETGMQLIANLQHVKTVELQCFIMFNIMTFNKHVGMSIRFFPYLSYVQTG
jgi:hypothetical protein